MGKGGKGGQGRRGMTLLVALLLLAGNARAQESVTFYTSLHEQNLPVLIAAFEKKHGVKVKAWRSAADKCSMISARSAGCRSSSFSWVMRSFTRRSGSDSTRFTNSHRMERGGNCSCTLRMNFCGAIP